MKLLHPVNNRNEVGFSDEEKLDARIAIYGNIMDCMVALIDAVDKLKIAHTDSHDDDDDVVSADGTNRSTGGNSRDEDSIIDAKAHLSLYLKEKNPSPDGSSKLYKSRYEGHLFNNIFSYISLQNDGAAVAFFSKYSRQSKIVWDRWIFTRNSG